MGPTFIKHPVKGNCVDKYEQQSFGLFWCKSFFFLSIHSVPTYIMDFGLDEFRPTFDGTVVKDGIGKCDTEKNITDYETDSDTEFESSETEIDTSSDEEEDQDVASINELCKVTKTLKMDE